MMEDKLDQLNYYGHIKDIEKAQTIKVFNVLAEIINTEPCSFRALIYDKLGFKPEDYEDLYKAGGMAIINLIVDNFTK